MTFHIMDHRCGGGGEGGHTPNRLDGDYDDGDWTFFFCLGDKIKSMAPSESFDLE